MNIYPLPTTDTQWSRAASTGPCHLDSHALCASLHRPTQTIISVPKPSMILSFFQMGTRLSNSIFIFP